MLPLVEEFIHRYRSLKAARRLGIAVSGGADSVALLRAFSSLAPLHGWELRVLHVNYGLRGEESTGDENFVRALAAELGCPVEVLQTKPIASDENTLRRLRYDWFATLDLDAVLTGHTLDDQAETVLFRFLRGTGPAGLAGILPQLEARLYRPLLAISRDHVREWLRQNGFVWREDSSNALLHYSRNRIRWELMPLLKTQWNAALETCLAQLAELSRCDEEWLAPIVAQALDSLSHWEGSGLILDCLALNAAPLGLRRRLLRAGIERVKGDCAGITFAHIDAALALLAEMEGNGRIQASGVDLMRSFHWLRIIRLEDLENLDSRNFRLPFDPENPIKIPSEGGWLRPTIEKGCQYSDVGQNLDWTRLLAATESGGRLEVRNWRPGDSYVRQAPGPADKLKELFQNHRIPLWQRRTWPIVVLRDSPVWARQFGPAAEWQATPETKLCLRLDWSQRPY